MKHLNVLFFVPLVLACGMHVSATEMFIVELPELATTAERIVQAQVTAIVPQWNSNNTLIYTYIRMNITDDFLGADKDREIIIKQPGGTIGTMKLMVEGTAEYKVGETAVLFLCTDPENQASYQTLGMYQGKYRVYTSSSDQVERVAQDGAEGVTLYKRSAGTEDAVTGNNLPLDQFKQLILQYRNGN